MAISTYGELLSAIETWLARSDSSVTANAADFVTLAQNRIRVDIDTCEQETVTTLSISGEYTNLPSGILSVRKLALSGSPVQALEYVTPQAMALLNQGATGKPTRYTIVNNQIQCYPIPQSTYTGNITYKAAYDAFTTSTATDYILTNYPNVYLYGSLLEANAMIMDSEEMIKYGTLYQDQVNRVNSIERDIKYPSQLKITKIGSTP